MTTKKLLILFVLASLAGHALLLALTSRIDWGGPGSPGAQPQKVLTVDLKTAPETPQPPARARTRTAPPPQPAALALAEEASVTLQGRGGPYEAYLIDVRRRIEQRWRYPERALAAGQEGDAIVRFTIDASGRLAACRVEATSGNALLDEGALAVVRDAAPYTAFPPAFPITRLNITATFRYQMPP